MYGKVWQFLFERFLDRDRDVPRVSLSLRPSEVPSEPVSPGTDGAVRVRWTIQIVLFNESSAAAADLKLVWPRGSPSFQTTLPYDLNPYEEKTVRVRGTTDMAREKVDQADGNELFERLLEQFHATDLRLTYRDVRGDYFHTRYARSEGRESVEFLRKLPPSPS